MCTAPNHRRRSLRLPKLQQAHFPLLRSDEHLLRDDDATALLSSVTAAVSSVRFPPSSLWAAAAGNRTVRTQSPWPLGVTSTVRTISRSPTSPISLSLSSAPSNCAGEACTRRRRGGKCQVEAVTHILDVLLFFCQKN